ncbi:MAG: GntR family transcriptional regulator, partial [Rhodospirillales bacterium]|nr:GntR family transcriptional regulator [Rhodospirillales bacterium]
MASEKDTKTGGKVTSSDRAYEMLRDRLLRFAILPNQRINEVSLAAELNVSRTPLREALNRLVAEGLLI